MNLMHTTASRALVALESEGSQCDTCGRHRTVVFRKSTPLAPSIVVTTCDQCVKNRCEHPSILSRIAFVDQRAKYLLSKARLWHPQAGYVGLHAWVQLKEAAKRAADEAEEIAEFQAYMHRTRIFWLYRQGDFMGAWRRGVKKLAECFNPGWAFDATDLLRSHFNPFGHSRRFAWEN